ncbi:hypothetical protein ACFLRH_00760 [Actinomycetota bacterium]
MTDTIHDENTVAALELAVDRGGSWLTRRIGADGHPGTHHGHYYRLPWSLTLTGHRRQAASVLSWVEREALDAVGDLRNGAARAPFERRWSSYPLAILATGAWHLERYDTALLISNRLHAYQDQESGGAFAGHPDHRESDRQDLFPTAQMGMTGLTTGTTDLAHGAYRWLQLVFDAQPELPTRLYTATTGGRLLTDSRDDQQLAWEIVTDFTKPRQAFYNPGIAAAFLGKYYMATGRAGALALARKYLDLTVSGGETQFDWTDSVQVCKFAWGSAALYEATGEEQYLGYVRRMATWFVECQEATGSWSNSPFLMERGGDSESIRVEVTAEFLQHLVTLITAVGGIGRRFNEESGDR